MSSKSLVLQLSMKGRFVFYKSKTKLTYLAVLLLVNVAPVAPAEAQAIVKYNGGDASQCLSIVVSQEFGQLPQGYFRSSCPQKVHMKFCMQGGAPAGDHTFDCDVRTGGSDIEPGHDVPTSVPAGAIPHVFACYDPLYPTDVKFNGHGLDGTCKKL